MDEDVMGIALSPGEHEHLVRMGRPEEYAHSAEGIRWASAQIDGWMKVIRYRAASDEELPRPFQRHHRHFPVPLGSKANHLT
jgi:hypothetical protein